MDTQRWRRRLLDKLGEVCAGIARLKAGETVVLADMAAPGQAGEGGVDPLTRLLAFKDLLNERLAALAAGEFGVCEGCGGGLSEAELDQIPWVARCSACPSDPGGIRA